MKISYRGHELGANRERCLAGYHLLYYSIFRESDGYECLSGFEDSAEKSRDKIDQLKKVVDSELLQDDPWCEKEWLDCVLA